MPSAPPIDAIATLFGPSSRITRRVDIYEEDSTTPFVLDAKIIEGGVSVDGTRDERRSFDIVLENIDGSLDNYPGGFWYDKIIKMYRGIEWDGTSASNLRLGLDPLYALDLDGTNGAYASTPWLGSTPKGLYLPGTNGHCATTPDHASFDVGDLDVRIRVAMDDWTPSANPYLVSKNGWGLGWSLRLIAGGTLHLRWHTGSASLGLSASAVTGIPDGALRWVRGTLDLDNGAGGHTARFYASTAEDPGPGDWTQIGADVVGAGTTAIAAGADQVAIGSYYTGNEAIAGLVKRAQVRNGIDGAIVLDVDFTDESQGWAVGDTAGATGVDATGKTWTINGASSIIRSTLDVTGDLDVRVYDVVADDWTPAATQALVSKWHDTGLQQAWVVQLLTDGALAFYFARSSDGVAVSRFSAPLGITAEERVSLRITRANATGVTNFYKSSDGVAWSLVTAAAATNPGLGPKAASSGIEIGSQSGGTTRFAGTIGRVEVRDGIDGPIVASSNYDQAALVGQTVYTDDQDNEWTLYGTAAIVDTGLDLADGYLATSDASGHNIINGTLYLAVKLSADDWTPAAIQTILSKWNPTGNQRSWKFSILTDGKLRLSVSTNGTNELNLDSTVATGFTNGSVKWIAVELLIDNGSGGKNANFLTSTDGIVFTPLGSLVTSATLGAANLADSNAPIRIGSATDTEFFVGNIYNAQISDDLRVVADLDFTSLPNDTQAVVDPNTGYAYSFNGDGVSIEGGLPEVKTWETQLGEFLIDRIDTQHFPHTAKANGRDYTKRLIEDEFGYATMFPEGEPIEEVIRTIALNGGITKFIFPFTGQTLGRDFLFEGQTTRWAACKEIATAYGYELFFDNQGYMVMREFQDPLSSPVAFTFETGEFGTLASYTKAASDTRIYNRIVVKNESTEVSPMVAVAENHEPSSPTSIENLGRTKTFNYSSAFFTSLEQMQDVADNLLKIHALESFEIGLESIVIPWLEATEIIEFVDPNPNPGDPTRFLLTDFNIPMSLGAMSANSKRVTVVG